MPRDERLAAIERAGFDPIKKDLAAIDALTTRADIVALGAGPFKVEVDLMQPLDPDKKPAVHTTPLNHVGLWVDDLPRAVDTDILTRATEAGVRTWSGDRFNFVSVRGVDRHAHTWPIADTALMNRAGHVAFFGDPREHVEV